MTKREETNEGEKQSDTRFSGMGDVMYVFLL